MKNYLWVFCMIFLSATCSSQPSITENTLDGKWNLLFTHSDVGEVRTYMDFEQVQTTFHAQTRKDADKDILGGWTSLLGRVFTKTLKEGALLRVENGIWKKIGDTIRIKGIFTSPLGNYNLNGFVVNGELNAELTNKTGVQRGFISGNKKKVNYPLENYSDLLEKSIFLTETNIYDKKLTERKEWKNFKTNMKKVTPKLQDDLEMIFAFYYHAGKLPFSHYALLRNSEFLNKRQEKTQMELQEKNKQTVYWKLNSFAGSSVEIDSIFEVIKKKDYKNLIVDLRNNAGGNIDAGLAFVNQLIEKPYYGGVFLTRKWFDNHKDLPQTKDYSAFLNFNKSNYYLLLEGIHKNEGICLKTEPVKNVYQGQIYILVNHKTASTCEPIVYGLKHNGRAIIIGEKTAGAMLNSELFDLDSDYRLIVPTADYYTVDGFKIDQNGVEPNIQVQESEALDYVLDKLM